MLNFIQLGRSPCFFQEYLHYNLKEGKTYEHKKGSVQ